MKKFLLAPSILAANFSNLGLEIIRVLSAGCNLIHFDVMDNHYVPNLSMGPLILDSIIKYIVKSSYIDVHLMANPVEKLINIFAKKKVHSISFHPETSKNILQSLSLIKNYNCKAGLVINPNDSIDFLYDFMDKLDIIVVMLVNPGFGNQKLILKTINKVKKIKKMIKKSGYNILIEVDGGITIDNINKIAKSGADIFVIGSTIFNSKNYLKIIQKIRQKLKNF
ncbi:Ribulose-phosphate 3-epimerase [Candidatus Annandia adelgestsuga]|uniref:Ribulose-phosphate 3-epimerase n=1 Tax=Candidatus Annandia adelgestsuga TaxID=1302411 RepID=A0A3S9J7N5_9ENTR|nr:ribulose-phosphate 3-epimerase [Candidatus Annandia adelgestsuga]AZP36284.1 Ribulose-phosphate 3-epimerase [Candidatus Annandia adelgestsuga]